MSVEELVKLFLFENRNESLHIEEFEKKDNLLIELVNTRCCQVPYTVDPCSR